MLHTTVFAEEAQKIIEGLTRKVHEGEIFSGVVTRRVERVEDVVRQGDEVTVRVREIDSRGRINLTLRGVHKMEACLIQNLLQLQ